MIPVILSGGSGSRLWPISRELYPKQLLPLTGSNTMLQETILRVQGIPRLSDPLIVCNEEHRFMVAEQLRACGVESKAIILEPCGRNTAPAVAVAALSALANLDDALLLVLPADHVIADKAAFHAACTSAVAFAEQGKLVTFGVTPIAPETGYGYIKAGAPLASAGHSAFKVSAFVEKPDLNTAKQYFSSGDYLWNSGMFLFSAKRYLEELQAYAPQIFTASCEAYTKSIQDRDFTRLDLDTFKQCPGDSVDYAVMEKTADAVVVPLNAGWNDVGSWTALLDVGEKDTSGNLLKGDVLVGRGCKLIHFGRAPAGCCGWSSGPHYC